MRSRVSSFRSCASRRFAGIFSGSYRSAMVAGKCVSRASRISSAVCVRSTLFCSVRVELGTYSSRAYWNSGISFQAFHKLWQPRLSGALMLSPKNSIAVCRKFQREGCSVSYHSRIVTQWKVLSPLRRNSCDSN